MYQCSKKLILNKGMFSLPVFVNDDNFFNPTNTVISIGYFNTRFIVNKLSLLDH